MGRQSTLLTSSRSHGQHERAAGIYQRSHVLHHGRRQPHLDSIATEMETDHAMPSMVRCCGSATLQPGKAIYGHSRGGPTQLSRRLVSTDEIVYATLGYDAPLSALDAATGKSLREYAGSDGTEEIIHTNGMLFLVVPKAKPNWRTTRR